MKGGCRRRREGKGGAEAKEKKQAVRRATLKQVFIMKSQTFSIPMRFHLCPTYIQLYHFTGAEVGMGWETEKYTSLQQSTPEGRKKLTIETTKGK